MIFKIFKETPEFDHSFQLTMPTTGFGGLVVKPWEERKRSIFDIQEEVSAKDLGDHRSSRADVPAGSAPECRNGLPVEFVIASTASHEELVRFAERIVAEATKSGQFAFPPLVDVRIDQAKSEIAIDRDKVASMGLSMQQIGADLSSMLSGNFVNRFNIDGRSYKVIPQIERTGRLTSEQLNQIYVTGPGGQVMPLSSIATIQNGIEPRTLNRFQQLNAVKLSGLSIRSLESALRYLEDTATKILPPGYRVDYTGESRQLRQEGGKFLPAMMLALVLIFLVLAAQFNSFRDPLVILGRLGAAGAVWRADLYVPEVFGTAGNALCADGKAGRRRSTSTRRLGWSRSSGSSRKTAS